MKTRVSAPQASNNQLRVLPATLGNLPNIRQMWLDHNVLEALPPTIGTPVLCCDTGDVEL
jgi:hypothetical protein